MTTVKTGKKRIKVWHILLMVVGVIALGGAVAILTDTPERQELQTLAIGSIDFANLMDGTYIGEYSGTKGNSRDASVEVTISGGEITAIQIRKGAVDSDGNLKELADGMTMDHVFQRVIASKSLQVDAISGATLTSKAHLKALENALAQALAE